MKQLVCEICGGIDLIKQDGIFVCQNCGTKYSVEDAKKMMIEGTVEVAGTVKVDNSDKLNKLYQIARRAKDDNNSENAAKYYDMVLIEDPNSWEAIFYSVYFRAQGCELVQINFAAVSVCNCISTVLKLIRDTVSERDGQEKAVVEVAECILDISHYTDSHYSTDSDYRGKLRYTSFACCGVMYNLGNELENIFGDEKYACDWAVTAWKLGVKEHFRVWGVMRDNKSDKNTIENYVKKIKKYDTTYQGPDFDAGGCYIATAVYGSYDAPEVLILRKFRDNILAKSLFGRVFIKIYYTLSPPLAEWLKETKNVNLMVKVVLDKLVKTLQTGGAENAPYEDKNC